MLSSWAAGPAEADSVRFDVLLTRPDGEGVPGPLYSRPAPAVELPDIIDEDDDGRCAWLAAYVEYGQWGRDRGDGRLGDDEMVLAAMRGDAWRGRSVMVYVRKRAGDPSCASATAHHQRSHALPKPSRLFHLPNGLRTTSMCGKSGKRTRTALRQRSTSGAA